MGWSDDARLNRDLWTTTNAEYTDGQAARLLRAHGRLVFMCGSPLVALCGRDDGHVDEGLHRSQFGLHRLEWPGEGVEFQLAHGEWIALLRTSGFEVERLVELQAPPAAETHRFYRFVSADWARRWPAEEIWVARKR